MRHRLFVIIATALIAVPAASSALDLPDNWDGLTKVPGKRLDAVYLLRDADFRGYSKVMLDRPEVAFKKDWKRDYNSSQRSIGSRVDDADIRKAIDLGTEAFMKSLTEAYGKAGFQVVDQPGPDVLRVSTAIVNIEVDAPDTMTAARSRTFAREAGRATLIVEARDSVSGHLMGRALDAEIAGDTAGSGPFMRNSVTNRADFEQLFDRWARTSAQGLTKLKSMSPVTAPAN